ncbi:ACT domain-containing protein [uncultured Erythrobacter sp.]|uniref:ACT domain-containing protein n=1 Tax=uncultured Erythrobacter sp. TaxID=263913 RepID=UPI0026286ADF|nr:ACT domain-containing protein [uncultured Erythrobacter sp.]
MAGEPVSDLQGMLAGMEPVMLDIHGWVFLQDDGEPYFQEPFATIREAEGTTFIMAADPTDEGPFFARITLSVHSDLEGVGLTAAVASTLAEAGIACNVIAAFHHDHLFVPWDRREEALALLERLSLDARR